MQPETHSTQPTQFVALPGAIISYIVDIINNPPPPAHLERPFYNKHDIILNVYKAFECFIGTESEDSLWDYKKNVQHYIASFVFGAVLQQLCESRYSPNLLWLKSINNTLFEIYEPFVWYNSTDREVMYFYDVLFCNPEALLHGENYVSNCQTIIREVFDCNYYVKQLSPEYYIQNDASVITVRDIPVIRLLEEALYNNSTECINCLMTSGLFEKEMLLYIYIKHNHKVWGNNKTRSLANNDILFNLLLTNSNDVAKRLLLQIAIGGLTIKNTNSIDLFNNVVEPNLEFVKKMVPEYFPRYEEFPCALGEILGNSKVALTANAIRLDILYIASEPPLRTPFEFWRQYGNRQIYKPAFLSRNYQQRITPKNIEIGRYCVGVVIE